MVTSVEGESILSTKSMMPKRFFYCFLSLALWACGGEEQTATQEQTQDVITIQIESEPPSLHPTNARTTYRDLILGLVHQRLHIVDITNPGSIMPEMAIGDPIPVNGGESYTLKIHPEAAWPDGAPITSEDVLFTFKVIACPLTDNRAQKGYLEFLSNVRGDETDSKTVHLDFREYYMNNKNVSILSFILDKRKFDPDSILSQYQVGDFLGEGADSLANNEDIQQWASFFNDGSLGKDPEWLNHGSGPYEVTEWIPEQQIVLTRRESYWGAELPGYIHRAYPQKLIFKIIREDASLELQIKEQRIDVASLSIQSSKNLSESELVLANYDLVRPAKASIALIVWNNRPESGNRDSIFQDVRVRRAMAFALPIDSMLVQNFALPQARAVSPVSPSNPDHNDTIQGIPHNPVYAKQLLGEAGWADSDGDGYLDRMVDGQKKDLEFEMMFSPNSQAVLDIMSRIEEDLAKVGVRMIQKQASMQEYLPQVIGHQFDAALFAMGSSDLPYDFDQVYHSESWGGGSNLFGYRSADVDSWTEQARIEKDPEVRKDLVDKIQAQLYYDQPGMFFFHPRSEMAIAKKLQAKVYPVAPHLLLNMLRVERGE